MASPLQSRPPRGRGAAGPIVPVALWGAALLLPALAFPAQTIEQDPKGFRGIPWGASLQSVEELEHVSSWRFIDEYEYKDGPPKWADVVVDSLKLSAVYGKFARVSITYRGEDTHKRILDYLESRFGRIDLMPGAMMRGLSQAYTWRGTATEINLTYQGHASRGFIYIESRTFSPGFNDVLPEHAY